MSNLFSLLKINLANYLNFNQIKSADNFATKVAAILKILLFIALYFMIGLFIYYFAKYMARGFAALNMPSLVLNEFFAVSSVFVLAISVFKMDIFVSKDHDLLLSLPLKKSTIITSKLIGIYIFNLFIIFLLMIPAFLVYTYFSPVTLSFGFRAIVSLFIIPIIPTTLAVFINSLITIVSTKFKHTKIIQTVLMLILILFSVFYSFNINSKLELNIFDIEGSFTSFFNELYPLTPYFNSMLVDNDILSTIVFVGISLLFLLLLILFLSLFYTKVSNRVSSNINRSVINYQKLNNAGPLLSIFNKDLKRVLTSPNYLLNSCLGLIFIVLFATILLFINLDNLENTPITKAVLTQNLPLVFMFIIFLSCTTSSQISLEGQRLYILKMLPLKFKTIWQAKVLSNFFLIMVSSIFALILFNISLDLTFDLNIKCLILILSSASFISLFGLTINLLFPNFSWKSEIKVIKQSAASFITLFTGLLLGIFLAFNNYTSTTGYIYFISSILLIVSLIIIIFLNVFGPKIYQKLNN